MGVAVAVGINECTIFGYEVNGNVFPVHLVKRQPCEKVSKKTFSRLKTGLTLESPVSMMALMKCLTSFSLMTIKQSLSSFAVLLVTWTLVSCDGGNKPEQQKEVSLIEEQTVPKTPGEKLLSILSQVQDRASADAYASEVKDQVSLLPKDISNEDVVNIVNELLRLNNKMYYGSSVMEEAVKGIKFDAGEYTNSVPLDVDGFEPTPEVPEK